MNKGYDLTVINDENVPLAAGVGNDYTGVIMGIVLFTVLAFLLFLYIRRCQRYRIRLLILQCEVPIEEQEKLKFSWNLWKLHAEIQDLESKAARHMVPY